MTIRVGIIGTGWGTRIQVPAFRQAGLQVTALWGRSKDKASQIAAELDIPWSTTDAHALIQRPDVDLVSIVVPPKQHAELSIAALQAGKHVLCEKPTAMNAAEAAQMLAAAEAHPQQLALIDHELRFLSTRQAMRDLIRQGYVGQVCHVETTALLGSRLDVTRPWNWWSQREQGGGVLGALGSHMIDMASWLLGQRVIAVTGELRTIVTTRPDANGQQQPVTSDDHCTALLQFTGDISGEMRLSVVTAMPALHQIRISGTEGSLVYTNGKLLGYKLGSNTPEDLTITETYTPPPGHQNTDWLRGTCYIGQAIKTAIESGDTTPLDAAATFADGLYIQQVIDAIHKAHHTRQWVAVSGQ